MKKFTELLVENNIKIPRTNWGCKHFAKRWNKAETMYLKLVMEVEKKEEQWEKCRKKLEEDWEDTFPSFWELNIITKLTFTKSKEAEKQIEKQLSDIKKLYMYNFQRKMDFIARRRWVKDIVSQAGYDCELVIIKGRYVPVESYENHFYENVSKGKPTSIGLIGQICPIWVAFNPHKSYNTQTWVMNKSTSTVEYIRM